MFTTDIAGNVLMPMNWQGVLVRQDTVPVARLLRGQTSLEAFIGRRAPITIPGPSFLSSYALDGGKLPPIFDPQAGAEIGNVTFFGSADAPSTVLRIARRGRDLAACVGEPVPGLPCNVDLEGPNDICTVAACDGGDSKYGTLYNLSPR